jgi:hypothetical protein
MTLPEPSIVLSVDSTPPHIEQGRYRPAEHGGSHHEGSPLRPMKIKNVNVTVARMLAATGEDRHLGQASTSTIRLCKKAWMPAVQALSRASSMRYERL